MPTYEITIPGSGTYQVDSPRELTDSQAYKLALEQSTPRTTMEQVQHVAGVAGRGMAPVAAGAVIGAPFGPVGMLAGSLTLPLAELGTQAANVVLPKQYQIPSPASAVENLLTKLGLPQAETMPERMLQAASGATGGAVSQVRGATELAKTGATELGRKIAEQFAAAPGRQIMAAGPSAAAAQVVGEETGNPLYGAGAGMATGAVLGTGARGRVGPTAEELAARASQSYEKAAQSGIEFNNKAFRTSMAGIVGDLRQEGYSPTAYPKIQAISKELTNGRPKDFIELQALRKIIQGAQASQDGTERALATSLKDKFDEYVMNAPASHFTGTNNKAGAEAWQQARTEYSRMKKGEIFDEMLTNAELDKSKFTQSGPENSMAAQLRQLAKNKSKMRLFTEEEQNAITAAAKGGPVQNLLKFFGKFAPTGPITTYGAGVASGNNLMAIPFLAAAGGARAGTTAMRQSSIERLADMMRLGGQMPRQIPVPAITGGRGLISPQVPLDVTSEQLQQIYGQ
jgi:hypothetical protein